MALKNLEMCHPPQKRRLLHVTIVDPQSTPLSEITPTATPEPVELKIWIPPMIAERTEEGAQILADQLQAFSSKNPDVSIEVEHKQSEGPGVSLAICAPGVGLRPLHCRMLLFCQQICY